MHHAHNNYDLQMVIRGFIDESYSGNQRNGPFTLACLFVRPEILAWFEMAWIRAIEKHNERLLKNGRKPVTRFHAADLNGGKGEFVDWKPEERIEFAQALIQVIRRHNSTHWAWTMELADVRDVWPESGDEPMAFAYDVIMKQLMLDIGEVLLQENMREQIDFVIERGPGAIPMVDAFNQLMRNSAFQHRRRFGTIRVGGWESDVLLQVADLFAYEAYKDAVRRGKNIQDPRLSMAALLGLDSVGLRTRHLPKEALAEIKRHHSRSEIGR